MCYYYSWSPPDRVLLISVFVFLLLWKTVDFPLAEGRVVTGMRLNYDPGTSGRKRYQDVLSGDTKESGPSPGGGHVHVKALVPTRLGIDRSGPSPGVGHKYVVSARH
ncbi:hypothetical protein MLD38_030294 [Melastoma candidum]|uniref:Uncharacterized protein n=1 Tax=Melastoma candidum TaxID=119954 RepID=A0ACB9MMS0_9MYRT|nr:hypothetical protein MLD38_030294 [Melastoma candidum]